jgi:hypothetical protein
VIQIEVKKQSKNDDDGNAKNDIFADIFAHSDDKKEPVIKQSDDGPSHNLAETMKKSEHTWLKIVSKYIEPPPKEALDNIQGESSISVHC